MLFDRVLDDKFGIVNLPPPASTDWIRVRPPTKAAPLRPQTKQIISTKDNLATGVDTYLFAQAREGVASMHLYSQEPLVAA
jgi:hypothetical protein